MSGQLLLQAEAQFTGFIHAKQGYSVKSLAESMGLKKGEWVKLRDKDSLSALSVQDRKELDNHFGI